MIGIIGAMTIEVDELKSRMTDKTVKTIADMEFVSGLLCGTEVVVTVCGEGKVNAAMCTQAMILEYKPDIIVNTGVGGGLAEGLKIGDIVVADAVVEHDMDMSPLGFEKGYICGIDGIEMKCDKKISNLLCGCVAACEIPYRRGIVATGDQFISSDEKKQWLRDTFSASVCEMEGGAIGHVCQRNNIPFGVLRAISDGGDDDAKMSFPEFAALAAANSVKVMTAFAENFEKGDKIGE